MRVANYIGFFDQAGHPLPQVFYPFFGAGRDEYILAVSMQQAFAQFTFQFLTGGVIDQIIEIAFAIQIYLIIPYVSGLQIVDAPRRPCATEYRFRVLHRGYF